MSKTTVQPQALKYDQFDAQAASFAAQILCIMAGVSAMAAVVSEDLDFAAESAGDMLWYQNAAMLAPLGVDAMLHMLETRKLERESQRRVREINKRLDELIASRRPKWWQFWKSAP